MVHLAAAIPPVEPPAGLKVKLLDQIGRRSDPRAADRAAAGLLPGFHFAFGGDGGFVPTPYPGVQARVLHVDPARRQFSVILKLEPGARLPGLPHDGPEECVVLEGEFVVGGVRMRTGDYQRAEPGTRHVDQYSETGAVVFVTAPIGLLHG